MKVLQILNELKPSGGEVMIEIASEVFKENDLDIDILSTGYIVGDYEHNFIVRGYRVFHIPFSIAWRIISPIFLFKLYKFIKNNKYDVVHIHPEKGRLSYAIIAYLAGTKGIVTTVHHIFPPDNSGLSWLKTYVKIFRRWFMRNILKVIIISNSKSGLKNEQQYYKSDNKLISNWFDDTKYKLAQDDAVRNQLRQELKIKENDVVFVSLGGNWEYKNYNLILEAMVELKDEKRVVYLQLGPDKEQLLSKQKNQLGLGNNVKLLGRVDDVLPYLYASDVYIMPSTIEGFGVAAVEAMGTGLPAILSNRPALYDFKDDSKDIVYIEPTNTDIAQAMKQFLEMDKKEIKDKGKLISNIITNKYGLENGAQKHAELYRSLVG